MKVTYYYATEMVLHATDNEFDIIQNLGWCDLRTATKAARQLFKDCPEIIYINITDGLTGELLAVCRDEQKII